MSRLRRSFSEGLNAAFVARSPSGLRLTDVAPTALEAWRESVPKVRVDG